VKVQLERSAGVGDVLIVGGQERAASNVTQGKTERTLRTLGRLQNAEQFDELVVANVNGAPVRIRDIGHAEDGTWTASFAAYPGCVRSWLLRAAASSAA
jgi:hydrophobic/amphiphilic exporter-1 (mainly G- bacteria), HAE1 family